jgi:hypothetical protein
MNLILFLIAIISFLGFPFGLLLSILSPEEMKSGKKYFELIQNLLLTFILFFIFDYYLFPLLLSIVLTITVFLSVFCWKSKNKGPFFYSSLAILLFLSSKNTALFAMESSLIFLYGIPTGSLIQHKNEGYIKIITKHSTFLILFILLLLFF